MLRTEFQVESFAKEAMAKFMDQKKDSEARHEMGQGKWKIIEKKALLT